ncbi:MAG TPA: multidrug efflux RND transporter permease subunit [Tepidisphaeraceae bacterium]|nr:multidrug efflux RND transporter permease subunit [Tepidisphaeraceae bacterium]
MFSKIFIDRPIFASVLSIIIVLGGLVAMLALPVAQYPEIAPPTVNVSCAYPGAAADVVAETVASPIEQQVNGVERMLYMSSQSNADGSYSLDVTFELGTNLDTAQVLVQNRVQQAIPSLPDVVKNTGVTVRKKSPSIMLVVNLISPDERYDQLYLSNYATIQIRDELARIAGVGDVLMLGQRDYSMRVWLDPEKLAARSLTATDVIAAVREQNVQVAAGKLGAPPTVGTPQFQYTMSTRGRLRDADEFGEIVLKSGEAGEVLRLGDVARIERSAKSQDQSVWLDGKPSIGLAVFQMPGGNAINTAAAIRAKMTELKARFPEGLDYAIAYDTTPFISESIRSVVHTLLEAVVLVVLVVLLFLQSWRATLIPLIAVPVSIIGTFAVMAGLGFSINNLTLFGMVLAIGIVVDDAIVVVEAVEHNIAHGLSPYDATVRAMQQVAGPVVAIGLVLCAVFVPCAFITGITGQFFRQFALTIAVSTAISVFNSLTLSPALAALLLKPKAETRDILTRVINGLLGWFFRLFNKAFDVSIGGYAWAVGRLLRFSVIVLVLYGGLLFLTYRSFMTAPVGFIPSQDKGYALVDVQLPNAASVERTYEVFEKVREIAQKTPGVKHTMGVVGQSFLLNAMASNSASIFVVFDEFEHRAGKKELYADSIIQSLRQQFYMKVPEASAVAFGAPPVDGLGSAGGFKVMVQDRGSLGVNELQRQTQSLVASGNETTGLTGLFSGFRADTPQLFVDIDRTKAKSLGVPLSDVFATLQVYLGGYYANDFNEFGRTWQVNLQADAPFRMQPSDVGNLKVRNTEGRMVPLGALGTVRDINGATSITRFNMYPSAAINGSTSPGVSSGAGIGLVETLAERELPGSFGIAWTEITLQQILAGNTAIFVFAFAVVFVFLVLAAQYESWALPLAVILVVPMCLLCSLLGTIDIARMDMNIFVQIGFVVLVGLASKNAILIVEFAKDQQDREGKNAFEATIEACRLRLRPILMTSAAFILGVVPLMLGSGAGAEMRRTLGVAVFSGMLGVTIFGIFLTPVFYYAIRYFSKPKTKAVPDIATDTHAACPPAA